MAPHVISGFTYVPHGSRGAPVRALVAGRPRCDASGVGVGFRVRVAFARWSPGSVPSCLGLLRSPIDGGVRYFSSMDCCCGSWSHAPRPSLAVLLGSCRPRSDAFWTMSSLCGRAHCPYHPVAPHPCAPRPVCCSLPLFLSTIVRMW